MSGLSILHITNGDSASGAMRAAGVDGVILPWEDALHDGPTPARLSLAEFSAVRADFVAGCGWVDADEARRRFKARDDVLRGFRHMREVALWFEHDLYDQLQLIQVMDWLGRRDRAAVRVRLAQSSDYLAELSGPALLDLFEARGEVTAPQWAQAGRAWAAFTAPDPRALEAAAREAGPLPFLAQALRRHLEEFPWSGDGLARSERQVLRALEAGNLAPGELFRAAQAFEGPRYMGDWSFWLIVERLHQGAKPLLETQEGPFRRPPTVDPAEFRRRRIRLSAAGRSVLAGEADQIALNGCHRWLGGARITSDSLWRWNPEDERLEISGNPA